MKKSKTLTIIFILLVLSVLSINLVFAQCPTIIDTPNELREELRELALDFLSNPAESFHTRDGILDLLDFYKDEKEESKILECDALGARTSTQVYTIMEKTIVFERHCEPEQTRDCGKTDVGVCELGTQTCGSTYIWGPCMGEVRPSDEICDDKDNNCNGKTDEDLTRSTNEIGPCSVNTETCLYGDYVQNNEYTPIPEPACDADDIDNDCDGNEAPTCPSLSLSASPLSIPADEATTSTITATASDSKSNVIISFSSNRAAADTILPSTCTTGADGKCPITVPITVKSLTVGISTITASAEGYLDGNIELAFTNIKPTAQPIAFIGPNNKGSTITLQCTVDDVNANDNPVNEKLTVKVWAGQCDPDDCSATRSWDSGTGIIYYEDIPMDAAETGNTETGNIFTKTLTINQEVGTGLAATCLAIDSAGDESTFGDAYQLLTVGCPAASPTFSSITSSSDLASSGTITIAFTASDALIEAPKVTLKNKGTDIELDDATYMSKTDSDYTYEFQVEDEHMNGPTKIEVSGKTSEDPCSIGSSIAEFNIDTQPPSASVSHSPASPTTNDAVTITSIGNDVDKDEYQSSLKEIRIFVDDALKQTCTASPCVYSSLYLVGAHNYYTETEDNAGNIGRDPPTGTYSFTVTAPIPVCSPPTLSCSTVSATGIQASWSAVSGATNYHLEWCPSGLSFGSSNCGITTNPDTTTLALGLQSSTTYNMRARAESAWICKAPGAWSETTSCTTQAKIPTTTTMQVPILVLSYYPLSPGTQNLDPTITGMTNSLASIRSHVNQLADEGVDVLTKASTYRGYKDSAATPSLNYFVHDTKEFLTAIPASNNQIPWKIGQQVYRPDYMKILNDVNICNYVDNLGVRHVWMFGYHTGPEIAIAQPPYIEPKESNMAMGTASQAFWNHEGYGDISNSEQINDMPTCSNTYTLYNYNYGRGLGEIMEDHGHQIEAVFNWIDGRDTTPEYNWGNLLFWGKFVGPHGSQAGERHCGWTHFTPNGQGDYDWYRETSVLSDCEDWKPDGTGEKKLVNCHTWSGSSCADDGGVAWKTWWMQNIPGKDNNLVYQGRTLRNWWDFIGDFDAAIAQGKSLTS